MVCASVGDSRGILIADRGDPINFNIIELSHDHKPNLPGEYERIISRGGMVDQITSIYGEKLGPQRVWKAGCNYPGLAMSRSLGDFQAKECGVIPTPDINEIILNSSTKYMIICSDGIWEVISNEQVKELGNQFYKLNDVGGLCYNLIRKSIDCWEQFDIIRDDITIVCVYF